MTPLTLTAPAKLNLSLRVVGRRDDGYHELDTILVLIDLADRLLLMPGCSGLRVTDPFGEPIPGVPVQPDENLAWRGLAAGLGGTPDDALACLTLEKAIPAAAGLGGGSSDAAAGWRLGRAWRGTEARGGAEEVAMLASIGADVPFFASEHPAARVTGIGEHVTPLPVDASMHGLLVFPPFGLATGDAFAASRPDDWADNAPTTLADALQHGTNDLLSAARRLEPRLDDLFALVVAAGGAPRLTGSGPTIFVVTDGPDRAASIVGRLARANLRAKPYATRLRAASIER